jgi:hypothetical protein
MHNSDLSPIGLLLRVLIRHFDFEGASHTKMIDIDPDRWNPHQEPMTKLIEYLTDSDTTRFAIDTSGKIYEMSDRLAFEDAHRDRVRFDFAFTLPNQFWENERIQNSAFAKAVIRAYAD